MEVSPDVLNLAGQFANAFSDPAPFLVTVLALLALLTVALPISLARRSSGTGDDDSRGLFLRSLYPAIVLPVSALGMCGFIAWVRLPTQPWYYIPFIGLAAFSAEFALEP